VRVFFIKFYFVHVDVVLKITDVDLHDPSRFSTAKQSAYRVRFADNVLRKQLLRDRMPRPDRGGHVKNREKSHGTDRIRCRRGLAGTGVRFPRATQPPRGHNYNAIKHDTLYYCAPSRRRRRTTEYGKHDTFSVGRSGVSRLLVYKYMSYTRRRVDSTAHTITR